MRAAVSARVRASFSLIRRLNALRASCCAGVTPRANSLFFDIGSHLASVLAVASGPSLPAVFAAGTFAIILARLTTFTTSKTIALLFMPQVSRHFGDFEVWEPPDNDYSPQLLEGRTEQTRVVVVALVDKVFLAFDIAVAVLTLLALTVGDPPAVVAEVVIPMTSVAIQRAAESI